MIGDHYQDEVWRAGAIISFVEIKKRMHLLLFKALKRAFYMNLPCMVRISMLVQAKISSVYRLALYEKIVSGM